MNSFIFFFKWLVLSVVKPSNLSILAQRMMTVIIVICHYQFIEGIDYFTTALRENEWSFITLIGIWHLAFMNIKIAEESRRKKYE
jgi:hypothetical protein